MWLWRWLRTTQVLVNKKKAIYRNSGSTSFVARDSFFLLGYTRDDGLRLVYLEAVGPHENFYRDLKH